MNSVLKEVFVEGKWPCSLDTRTQMVYGLTLKTRMLGCVFLSSADAYNVVYNIWCKELGIY